MRIKIREGAWKFLLCGALIGWCGEIAIGLVADTYSYFAFETKGVIESSHWDWVSINGRRYLLYIFDVRSPAGAVKQVEYPGQMLPFEFKPGTYVSKPKYSLSYNVNGRNVFWPMWLKRVGEILISSALVVLGARLSIRWGL